MNYQKCSTSNATTEAGVDINLAVPCSSASQNESKRSRDDTTPASSTIIISTVEDNVRELIRASMPQIEALAKQLSTSYWPLNPPPTLSDKRITGYVESIILDGLCEGLLEANLWAIEADEWELCDYER